MHHYSNTTVVHTLIMICMMFSILECSGLVTQALLTANFEAAVEVCLHNNRMAEAIILANAGGPDLLARTQKKFFHKNKGSLNRVCMAFKLDLAKLTCRFCVFLCDGRLNG